MPRKKAAENAAPVTVVEDDAALVGTAKVTPDPPEKKTRKRRAPEDDKPLDIAGPLLTIIQGRVTVNTYADLVESCKVIAEIQQRLNISDEVLLRIIKTVKVG